MDARIGLIGRGRLSADTSREAEEVQLRTWRSMSSVDKVRLIAGASEAARTMALAGLRRRYPHASDASLVAHLAAITLGPALARRVYPELERESTAPESP